jgi:TonB family C-terminal domain
VRKFIHALIIAVTLAGMALAQPSERQPLLQSAPEYPALLKKLGIGGTVKLDAIVAPDGSVKKTKIGGGNPMLAEIACTAVSKWKYSPAAQASTVPVEMVFDSKSASVRIK